MSETFGSEEPERGATFQQAAEIRDGLDQDRADRAERADLTENTEKTRSDLLLENAIAIRTELAKERRRRKFDRWMMALLAVLVIGVGVSVYKEFSDSHKRGNDTRSVIKEIKDCVEQGGMCYNQLQQQSKATTKTALDAIVLCYDQAKGDERMFITCLIAVT